MFSWDGQPCFRYLREHKFLGTAVYDYLDVSYIIINALILMEILQQTWVKNRDKVTKANAFYDVNSITRPIAGKRHCIDGIDFQVLQCVRFCYKILYR